MPYLVFPQSYLPQPSLMDSSTTGPTLGPSPQSTLLPVLAAFSLILCAIPLFWHIRNRNLAASALVLWVMLSNVFNLINPLIWPTDDMSNWWNGYGLCDIEGKLTVAANIGFPASLLCVVRYLAIVLDTKNTTVRSARGYTPRQLLIEATFCIGLPFIILLFHFVVQDRRYYIFAITGCVPSYDDSWLSIALIHVWGPVINLVAGVYAVVVIVRLIKYRRDFSNILGASASSLTRSRFLRLFLMSLILIVGALPLQLYGLVQNVSQYDFKPYSWTRVHAHWGEIIGIPTFGQVTIDHWVQVSIGFAVFLFFGLGKDAMKLYRGWLVAVGFAKVWPSLRESEDALDCDKSGYTASFGSRAQLWVKDRLSWRSSIGSGASRNSSLPLSTPPTTPDSLREKRWSFAPLSAIIETDQSASHPSLHPQNLRDIPQTSQHPQKSFFERISHITTILHQARLPTFTMINHRTASSSSAAAAYPPPSLPFHPDPDDIFATARVPPDSEPLARLNSSARSAADTKRDAADDVV